MGEGKSSTGIIINVVCGVFILGAVVWWMFFAESKKGPLVERLNSAEGALTAYLETADHFLGNRKHFDALELCVLKDDMEWFQNNWRAMFEKQDVLKLRNAVDPRVIETGGRRVVMDEVLRWGPHRQDVTILDREIGPASARITVRQRLDFGDGVKTYTDYRVYLEKEKDLWKVKDFCGFRAALENRLGPQDMVWRSVAEVEGTSGSGASAGGDTTPAAPTASATPAPDTAEYADMMAAWAKSYWERGDLDAAHKCVVEAVRIRTSLFGAEDPRTKDAALMVQQAEAAMNK